MVGCNTAAVLWGVVSRFCSRQHVVFLCSYRQAFAIYARGVVVIVVGNGYGDTSSNPGRD